MENTWKNSLFQTAEFLKVYNQMANMFIESRVIHVDSTIHSNFPLKISLSRKSLHQTYQY